MKTRFWNLVRLTCILCFAYELLPHQALAQTGDYAYSANSDGTITITGYYGSGGAVTIPDTINGLLVTSIGEMAFSFYTTSLTSVTLPESVTSIGELAFYGCTGLTSVTIPSGITNIGDWAFSGCTSLMAITVDAVNPNYIGLDGVLFNKSQTKLIQYPGGKAGSYVIPNNVTSIGEGAFDSCATLTSVTIPQSVTSIGGGAFAVCINLTDMPIPSSVTSIGDNAFNSCTSLTSVTIPESVTSIGLGTFWSCSNLTSVTIPESVTSIGGAAFSGCTSLTSVTIPNSVTRIWRGAFEYCANLTAVHFKGNAPSFFEQIFESSPQVRVYRLPGTTGWSATYAERPTALWMLPNPVILTTAPAFGIQTNGFGFVISWATNVPVVVEASANLTSPAWSAVSTNTLTGGWSYFSDPDWTNYPARFYRIRSN